MRLAAWTLLGLTGAVDVVYGALSGHWFIYGFGLATALLSAWMLGSGWFLRVP